jgi:two-component system chemotaxis sensor kinase CheA
MSDNDEFIAEFLEECGENLDQLDQELVALEDNPRDPERLKSIFRNIHTIKGSSGFFGFVKLGMIAHDGETLLGKVRDGEILFNQAIASGLLKMVDAIRELAANIEQTGSEGEKEYHDVAAELRGLLETQPVADRQQLGAVEESAEDSAEGVTEAIQEKKIEDVLPVEEPPVSEPEVEGSAVEESVDQRPSNPREISETREPTSQAAAPAKPASEATSIRVDIELLDELMDFAGELVLARNALTQCNESKEDQELASVTSRVSQITSEIQDRVMRTRMQPIGSIWGKFRRIVRDLSVSCGKEVRLELEGEETELDRSLLEAIRDPLTHIVRNSVDHGIEPPDKRVAEGKPREGVLRLRAEHESGQVIIEAIDDGGGIDVDKIRAKAIAKGLLSEHAAASATSQQILKCIFEPGFSMAEKVSAISGRGVGMDVVRSHIERIGGVIDLQSVLGQGTTLRIRIPLTLAIVPALMVGVAGQRFVIPQANLMEVIAVGAESQIERLNNARVYRLRDRLLPLVWLDEILELDPVTAAKSETGSIPVAVVQVDGHRFGIVVDEVLNTHEIVVKPIGASIKSIDAFSAATILGDGSVAMILDVAGIAHLAGLDADTGDAGSEPSEGEPQETLTAEVAGESNDAQSLLVCDVGGGRQVAIPLEMVERLEELAVSEIQQTDTGIAAKYRGSVLPILTLGQPYAEDDTKASVQLVVHRRNDQLIGVVVDRILDVVSGESVVQSSLGPTDSGAVVGMTLAGGRVIEVVDLGRI